MALPKKAFLLLCLLPAFSGCRQKDRFLGAPPANPAPLHGDFGAGSAVVVWNTDAASGSLLEYGPTEAYGATAGNAGVRVRNHKVALSGLAPSTQYHYRTRSIDDRGDTSYSYNRSFVTLPSGAPAPGAFTFGFDVPTDMEGWAPQDYVDSRAVTALAQTADPLGGGNQVMGLTVDLHFGTASQDKGEAVAELSRALPGDGREFRNMTDVVLTAKVFAPAGSPGPAVFTGTPHRLNGMQLFVKDSAFRSQYGKFILIGNPGFAATFITTGTWDTTNLSMTVKASDPGNLFNAYTDPGFDPTSITFVGVKIGANGSDPCTPSGTPCTAYAGPIYVDDLSY